MIIRIIPETEEERAKTQEKTISNVQEFCIFGNHINDENHLKEFHEWTGSFRYLIGNMNYYKEVINDERHEAWLASRRSQPSVMMPPSLRVVDDISIPSEVETPKDDKNDDEGEEKED